MASLASLPPFSKSFGRGALGVWTGLPSIRVSLRPILTSIRRWRAALPCCGPLRQEELFGQRGPIFVRNLRGEIVDRDAAVLRQRSQGRRQQTLQPAG